MLICYIVRSLYFRFSLLDFVGYNWLILVLVVCLLVNFTENTPNHCTCMCVCVRWYFRLSNFRYISFLLCRRLTIVSCSCTHKYLCSACVLQSCSCVHFTSSQHQTNTNEHIQLYIYEFIWVDRLTCCSFSGYIYILSIKLLLWEIMRHFSYCLKISQLIVFSKLRIKIELFPLRCQWCNVSRNWCVQETSSYNACYGNVCMRVGLTKMFG